MRDVTSVRVTVAGATGAVSFNLDVGPGIAAPSTHPPARVTQDWDECAGDHSFVAADRITVGIASVDPSLGRRLQRDLDKEFDIEVLDCRTFRRVGLRASARARHPDFLLLDRRLFNGMDEESRHAIREHAARNPVLLILDDVGPDTVQDILRNRFHGYLSVQCPSDICAKAIRAVRGGEFWLPRSLLAQAVELWLAREQGADQPPPAADGSVRSFTSREQEVLALLKQGLSNKQIARELGVVEDTVKKHLQNVYDKLGVRRRTLVLVNESRGA